MITSSQAHVEMHLIRNSNGCMFKKIALQRAMYERDNRAEIWVSSQEREHRVDDVCVTTTVGLEALTTKGMAPARQMMHAQVLLKTHQGEQGPGWLDAQIREAFGMEKRRSGASASGIENRDWMQQWCVRLSQNVQRNARLMESKKRI